MALTMILDYAGKGGPDYNEREYREATLKKLLVDYKREKQLSGLPALGHSFCCLLRIPASLPAGRQARPAFREQNGTEDQQTKQTYHSSLSHQRKGPVFFPDQGRQASRFSRIGVPEKIRQRGTVQRCRMTVNEQKICLSQMQQMESCAAVSMNSETRISRLRLQRDAAHRR